MISLLAQAVVAATLLAAVVVYLVQQWYHDSDSASAYCTDSDPWWDQPLPRSRMSVDCAQCKFCKKITATRCSKCKSTHYCSQTCQRKDWTVHKFTCERLQNAKRIAESEKLIAGAAKLAAGKSKAAVYAPNGTATANGTAAVAAAGVPAAAAPAGPPGQEIAPVPHGKLLFSYEWFLQIMADNPMAKRAPAALANVGNSCYANAIIQCMMASQPLRAFLDSRAHDQCCSKPKPEDWCLVCELQQLAAVVSDPTTDEVTLKPLLRHLKRMSKSLAYGRQEDTHEFFYSLVNTMESIMLAEKGGKTRYDVRTQETTLINHVYGGYVRQQTECMSCGYISRRFEHFMDVAIEIPSQVDDLDDALATYCADELLDGENRYQCDGCHSRVRARRSVKFEVAPNCLVLCLKRFGMGRFGKNNRRVAYGETLDLRPFMSKGGLDAGPAEYGLYGVVVHLDQMNSTTFGHYIAFVKGGDGRWYLCDDEEVKPVAASMVLKHNAYMLFYKRQCPKPAPRPAPAAAAAVPPAAAAEKGVAAAAAAGGEAAEAPDAVGMRDSGDRSTSSSLSDAGSAAGAGAANGELPEVSSSSSSALTGAQMLSRVCTAPAALIRLQQPMEDDGTSEGSPSPTSTSTSMSSSPGPPLRRVTRAAAAAGAASSGDGGAGGVGGRAVGEGRGGKHGASDTLAAAARGRGGGGTMAGLEAQQQQHGEAVADHVRGSSSREGGEVSAAAAQQGPGAVQLPEMAWKVVVNSVSLVSLRFEMPGVISHAEVTSLLTPEGDLLVEVPGKYASVEVPLYPDLVSPGFRVTRVTGKVYTHKGYLKLKLELAEAGEADGAGKGVVVHLHRSSSGIDSSSGEVSDVERRRRGMGGMHAVMSEADLSLLGRHADSRARRLLQQMASGSGSSGVGAGEPGQDADQMEQQEGEDERAGQEGQQQGKQRRQRTKGSSKKGKRGRHK